MSDDDLLNILEEHLGQFAVELIADINGDGQWQVPGRSGSSLETYEVDFDIDTGPVVLIRHSDGARFEVDVSVSVTPEHVRRCQCTDPAHEETR